MSTSTSVELIGSVRQGILGELADLRVNGPTRAEYASATETVRQALGLVSNEQINDEVLNVLTDPAGNPSFGDFLDQYTIVDELDLQTISTRLSDWLPLDHYISVTVAPR